MENVRRGIFDLTDKVAIVTGGTGFIGLAITKALSRQGARVLCGSASVEKAELVATQLVQDGFTADQVLVRKLDVTSDEDVEAILAEVLEKFGGIHILVNCAGVNLKENFMQTSVGDFQEIMDVNLFGAVRASQAVTRQMIKQNNGGVVVNICSVTSFQALSGVTTYACSKAALLALTRQMAVERDLIGNGIRTVAVAPGFVPAEQNRAMLAGGTRGLRILAGTPTERYCTPEEVAAMVAFLCTDAASGVNGSCHDVDGGFMINGVSEAKEDSLAVSTGIGTECSIDAAAGIGCNVVPDLGSCPTMTSEEQRKAQKDECPVG